jgi:hypothetical protein
VTCFTVLRGVSSVNCVFLVVDVCLVFRLLGSIVLDVCFGLRCCGMALHCL